LPPPGFAVAVAVAVTEAVGEAEGEAIAVDEAAGAFSVRDDTSESMLVTPRLEGTDA
jgi:hypothetical protein